MKNVCKYLSILFAALILSVNALAQSGGTFVIQKSVIAGVKYDRVGVVLVNAVKEQQAQIEGQQKEIDEIKQTGVILQQKLVEQTEANKRLAAQVVALKSLLCRSDPKADICKGVVK